MNKRIPDPIPARLKRLFEQLKQQLTSLGLYADKGLAEDVEELLDLTGELYYAVESELEMLQGNQLEEHVFYLQIPTTLDCANELYAEELEQLIARHGIEKITHHLRSL